MSRIDLANTSDHLVAPTPDEEFLKTLHPEDRDLSLKRREYRVEKVAGPLPFEGPVLRPMEWAVFLGGILIAYFYFEGDAKQFVDIKAGGMKGC